MRSRNKAATVVVAALGAIGLALPATASARTYSLPQYNPAMVVVVGTSSSTSVDTVSWSDVSWADSV